MPVQADLNPERAKEAVKVTIIGMVVNLVLAIGKFFAGWFGSSQALIADAVHSLSDLATDIVAYFSIRIASHGADEKHPYGHGRAETIGAALIGVALCFVGFGLVAGIVEKLLTGALLTPTWPAIAGAIGSIIMNEWLYQYSVRVGRKQNNQTIIANAWHHRSDSISSVAALLGVLGGMLGFPALDPLAAIVVVYMIVKVGWEIAGEAVRELMDETAPPEKMDDIRNTIMDVSGVHQFHELRARKVGADIFVDAHILVAPDISVSEAHNIAETVRADLKEKAEVTDALVHIDAEEDIHYQIVRFDRPALEEIIRVEAEKVDGIHGVRQLHLHLLKGKLFLDIVADMEGGVTFCEAKKMAETFRLKLLEGGIISEAAIRGHLIGASTEHIFASPDGAAKNG